MILVIVSKDVGRKRVNVLPECLFATYVLGARRGGQKGASDPLELKLWG